MKTRWITIMLAASASAAVFAQGPGATQPGIDEVKAALTLTEAQVTSLRTIQQQERDALQTIRTNVDTKQQALSDLLQKGSTDTNALGRLLVDIQALRTQMTQSQTPFRDQARNVLTAEQKTKLKTLEDASKLQDAIRQATFLNLIAPVASPAGRPRSAWLRWRRRSGWIRRPRQIQRSWRSALRPASVIERHSGLASRGTNRLSKPETAIFVLNAKDRTCVDQCHR
ncbi:MAG: Spy/CpxP family protein refolding chaperone [Bryobacteraceae bacterium]